MTFFPKNSISSPLHIKLGFIKQFFKALDKDGDTFKYICRIFLSLTIEKFKAGIFDGPQIRKLPDDKNIKEVMTYNEAMVWRDRTIRPRIIRPKWSPKG